MSRRGWDERTGSRVFIWTIKVNQNSKDDGENEKTRRVFEHGEERTKQGSEGMMRIWGLRWMDI